MPRLVRHAHLPGMKDAQEESVFPCGYQDKVATPLVTMNGAAIEDGRDEISSGQGQMRIR